MDLAYRTAGTGPLTAVFVHGFAQSSLYWQTTLDQLPTQMTGYAVDLPGFGDSHAVPGPYSMPSHAAAILNFVHERALGRVVLVGNSMGGVLCQLLAARYPDCLNALVLVSTGSYARDPVAARAAAKHQLAATWNRAEVEGYVQKFFVFPPADLEPYIDAALLAGRDARHDTALSSAGLDLRPELATIHVPTLIVQGGSDTGRTPADGAEMASLIPNSDLHVIPGVGHTPMLEDPPVFRELFHAFAARVAQTTDLGR